MLYLTSGPYNSIGIFLLLRGKTSLREKLMAAKPIQFISEVREELYKVTFPATQEVVRLTIIVIAVSVSISLFLAGLDYIFGQLLSILTK